MAIYIRDMDMPKHCNECALIEGKEDAEEIWCDNHVCLYCVNDTCTREPNEATVEAEISGKRDRDCPLSWR